LRFGEERLGGGTVGTTLAHEHLKFRSPHYGLGSSQPLRGLRIVSSSNCWSCHGVCRHQRQASTLISSPKTVRATISTI
jgi:hypothetical protein